MRTVGAYTACFMRAQSLFRLRTVANLYDITELRLID